MNGVVERARRFVLMLKGGHFTATGPHETPEGAPVTVRPIKFSDCYEIIDGNHRLAIAVVNGAERYPCAVLPVEPLPTPMQKMVMDSSWTEGNRILYQPIDLPEFRGWPSVRGCADH